MPAQSFTSPTGTTPPVTITWDFAFRAVDLAFGGATLARFTDEHQLRAGVRGPIPDGSMLHVRLVRRSGADQFEVHRDQQVLQASVVDWVASGPVVETDEPEPAPVAVTVQQDTYALNAAGNLLLNGKRVSGDGGARGTKKRSVDYDAISRGQRALGAATVVYSLLAAAVGYFAFVRKMGTVKASGVGVEVTASSTSLAKLLPIVVIVLGACAAAMLVTWLLSHTDAAEGALRSGSAVVMVTGMASLVLAPFSRWALRSIRAAADEVAALKANLALDEQVAVERAERVARRSQHVGVAA